MATVTTGKRATLRMDDLYLSTDGDVDASPTNVRITLQNGDYTDFGGSYTFSSATQFTGTVTSIVQVVGGKTVFNVTDVNADAQTLFAYLDAGDILGAQAYALRDADRIAGGGHDDVLYGFDGRDTLFGKGGDDTLMGGAGSDQLYGGRGADTFVYGSILDRMDQDTIHDFSHQEGDKIDLSAIDAKSRSAVDNAFVFDTNGKLAAGEIFLQPVTNGHFNIGYLIYGETDGQPGADFDIYVQTYDALTESDFIL